MLAQKRVEEFLLGKGEVLLLVGPAGSGKMHATNSAAKAAGFQATVLDRTQVDNINYNLFSARALGEDGLRIKQRSMHPATGTVRTDYSPTSPRRERRWTFLTSDDAGAETMQRESSAIQKPTTNGKCRSAIEERRRADHPGELPVVEAKSGEGHGLRGEGL